MTPSMVKYNSVATFQFHQTNSCNDYVMITSNANKTDIPRPGCLTKKQEQHGTWDHGQGIQDQDRKCQLLTPKIATQ